MLFDIGWSELLLIGVVALIFIGPKDLPRALRVAGYWVGRARTLSREFQSSVDQMIREAELEEMREQLKKATEFDIRTFPITSIRCRPRPSHCRPTRPSKARRARSPPPCLLRQRRRYPRSPRNRSRSLRRLLSSVRPIRCRRCVRPSRRSRKGRAWRTGIECLRTTKRPSLKAAGCRSSIT
jgi:Tat protein translocase TatB subunit